MFKKIILFSTEIASGVPDCLVSICGEAKFLTTYIDYMVMISFVFGLIGFFFGAGYMVSKAIAKMR